MERTTFKDLAVHYTYTPGQKGGSGQPEFAPQVNIDHLAHIVDDGSECGFDPETESALL